MESEFDAIGVRLVGVSFDPVEANAAFRDKYSFSFELWTDPSRALAIHFGAAVKPSNPSPRRHTVAIDAEGRQVLEYRSVMNVLGHPQQVLEDCRALFAT